MLQPRSTKEEAFNREMWQQEGLGGCNGSMDFVPTVKTPGKSEQWEKLQGGLL